MSFAHQAAIESPKILSDSGMITVANIIGTLVRRPDDFADAKPLAFAATIEPTHVHLLLGPIKEDISKCVGRMKGKSSSAVLAVSTDPRRHVWTAGFWKVFLYDIERVRVVKRYIDDHNLRRGLPADPYPWISPPLT